VLELRGIVSFVTFSLLAVCDCPILAEGGNGVVFYIFNIWRSKKRGGGVF
jgi:hypothetical protein